MKSVRGPATALVTTCPFYISVTLSATFTSVAATGWRKRCLAKARTGTTTTIMGTIMEGTTTTTMGSTTTLTMNMNMGMRSPWMDAKSAIASHGTHCVLF
eukprot:Rmarinus@m.14517